MTKWLAGTGTRGGHGAVLRAPTSRPRAHAARCATCASPPSRRARHWRSSWSAISQAVRCSPSASPLRSALLCEAKQALRQPNLAQLFVLLLAQLVRPLGVAMAQRGASAGRAGVVEDDLLVDGVVGAAERRIVDGQERELGGDDSRNCRRRHGCSRSGRHSSGGVGSEVRRASPQASCVPI